MKLLTNRSTTYKPCLNDGILLLFEYGLKYKWCWISSIYLRSVLFAYDTLFLFQLKIEEMKFIYLLCNYIRLDACTPYHKLFHYIHYPVVVFRGIFKKWERYINIQTENKIYPCVFLHLFYMHHQWWKFKYLHEYTCSIVLIYPNSIFMYPNSIFDTRNKFRTSRFSAYLRQ